ncbi:hypothetical protein R1sor_019166 [Riccia sorocarpa]|uniref:S-acyltransferase n=1 Tax=Riccia sorocarpa TaxID=122646 RepID=A0ABD3IF23_9MARC
MAVRTLIRHLQYMWASFILKVHIILDSAVKTAGPLYILLALSLLSCIIYLYYTAVLPAVHQLNSVEGIAHLIVSIWLIYNVFFNYYWCIQSDPGSPPLEFDLGADMSQYETGAPVPQMRWCKRCRKAKPPMTHHCHICKRCILKMDHHCPWMHNCIGFYNYRYFFVFLLYLWSGCIYTVYMASIPLFGTASQEQTSGKVNGVLFTFVLSLAVFGSLSCLLGWHIYLVLTAQTTIDFYGNRQRRREARRSGQVWVNEFDVGKMQNLRNVLDASGDRLWWLKLWLPLRTLPRGDGIRFPSRYGSPDAASGGNSSSRHSPPNPYSTSIASSSRESVSNGDGENNWRPANMV